MSVELMQGVVLGFCAGAGGVLLVAALMIQDLAYRKNEQIRAAYRLGIDAAVARMRLYDQQKGQQAAHSNVVSFPGNNPNGAA